MLKIGENIKSLRQSAEYTQEQLADILGVSPQAVSRWENGTTYPDITLLPSIANLFDITLDDLVGMEELRSEEQRKAFREKITVNSTKGLVYENILLLREELKNRPNDFELQHCLICALIICERKNGVYLTDEEKKSNYLEAVRTGERLLSRCTEPSVTNAVIKHMCLAYTHLGERSKAVEYAKKLPSLWCSSTVTLCNVLEDGAEKTEHLQTAITDYVNALYCCILYLADLNCDNDALSAKDRIAMLQKALAFYELVYDNEDYMNTGIYVSECHRHIAAMAMLENDHELAVSSLERSAKYAVMYDTLPEKALHTSLLVRGLEFDIFKTGKNYELTESGLLYKEMQCDRYDAIRSDERFTAILDKIKAYIILISI